MRAERDQQHHREEAAAGKNIKADIAVACRGIDIGLDLRRGEAAEIAERNDEGNAACRADAAEIAGRQAPEDWLRGCKSRNRDAGGDHHHPGVHGQADRSKRDGAGRQHGDADDPVVVVLVGIDGEEAGGEKRA